MVIEAQNQQIEGNEQLRENQDGNTLDNSFNELLDRLKSLWKDANFKDQNWDNITIHYEEKNDWSSEIWLYTSADKEHPVSFENGIINNCSSFIRIIKRSEWYRLYRNSEWNAENWEVITEWEVMDHINSINGWISTSIRTEISDKETAYESVNNNADDIMDEIMLT